MGNNKLLLNIIGMLIGIIIIEVWNNRKDKQNGTTLY